MNTQIMSLQRWRHCALVRIALSLAALCGSQAYAQAPAASIPSHSTLPIKQVTLFTSGVACTERVGVVDGSAAVGLVFRTGEINDILKSMVLIDRGGKVQPATYASKDPITHTLQGFAVDVADRISMRDLLGKLRGATVSVESPGKLPITGQILGVEGRSAAVDATGSIDDTYLSLLTDAGITSIRLGQEQTVRILDNRLNNELHAALTTLAGSTDNERRQVTLHFSGVGRREVRVAYVIEAPIWKISYRLVLSGQKSNNASTTPYLQGWAIVENTSDEDWIGVRLSLVSGRPVSFIQDLYQPLYIPRPEVGPDVVASPYPQTHDENLQSTTPAGSAGRGNPAAPAKQAKPEARSLMPDGIQPNDLTALSNNNVIVMGRYKDEAIGEGGGLSASVTAAASGRRTGEMFAYNVSKPVTLNQHQAAMIPVIAQDITADRISIYNGDLDGEFPMNALRLHNTTSLHLKGGPMTLFDGGAYAGDARIQDMPPGDTRIISYAVDQGILCNRTRSVKNLVKRVAVHRGMFTETQYVTDATQYTLHSRRSAPRIVLVEHPYTAGVRLMTPQKPTEQTGSLYRFSVAVPAGKTQSLRVVTERHIATTVALTEIYTDRLFETIRRGDISAKLRAELQEIVRRRKQIDDLKSQAATRTGEMAAITVDQDRIRKNMGALDKSSALYRRYVSELDTQETNIALLKHEATLFSRQATAADTALRAYIDKLTD